MPISSVHHGQSQSGLAFGEVGARRLPAPTESRTLRAAFILGGLQIPLALVMHRTAILATVVMALTVLGLLWLALRMRTPVLIWTGLAYLVGSEVLWRMSNALVFWETAKYAVIGISLLTLFRLVKPALPFPAILYILCLLPSAILTYFALGRENFRKPVLFNIAGPLAVAIASCALRNIRFSGPEFRRLLIAVLLPVVGIGAICAFSVYGSQITFGTQSNHDASGGFGPNQVSSALSLGSVIALLLAMTLPRDVRFARVVFIPIALFLAVQAALTFSRSGIYLILASLLVAAGFLRRRLLARGASGLKVIASIALAAFLLLPVLDNFTGGALSRRFEEKGMTGRETLMATDVGLFLQHPLYGVGIGVSRFYHSRDLAAHSEFSRLLAEHGILGLVALGCLMVLAISFLMREKSPEARALKAVLLTWSILFLFVNSTRTALPSLMFALCSCRYREEGLANMEPGVTRA